MSEVIAERLFRTPEGRPVVARIYIPEKMGQSSEWSCRVEVQGLEAPFEKSSIGVDSFQALCSGLRLLCVHLDKIATLTFLDGEAGDCGTPLIMPWTFGPSLKAEVYRLIEGKIEDELDSSR
jgi:uncharacterized protein DUF6968